MAATGDTNDTTDGPATEERIVAWCLETTELGPVEGREHVGTEFAFGVGRDVALDVRRQTASDQITIRHEFTLVASDDVDDKGGFLERLAETIASRPAIVQGEGRRDGANYVVELRSSVYVDGLTKHTFLTSVAEIRRTRELVDGLATEREEPREPTVAEVPAPVEEPAPDEEPALAGEPAPDEEPVPAIVPAPAEVPTEANQPTVDVAAPGPAAPPPVGQWTPSHVVPAAGLAAWLNPDPATQPAATLDPALEVQLLDRYGNWAHIRCSNGWEAWVDGEQLSPKAPST